MFQRYISFVLALALIAILSGPAAAEQDAAVAPSGANATPIPQSTSGSGVVDFESLNLPLGTQIDPPDGVPTTVDGFTFTPGPNNDSGLNDSHYGNAVNFWCYNGTHVALNHDDVVMTKEDGGAFDLISFDLAGFPTNSEVPFTVTGQPGNVVANYNPDGLVDGPGGATDFETFVLPTSFRNLTSVTFEHSGSGTLQGLFGLDNLVTTGPVSVDPKSFGDIKGAYR